MTEKDQLDLSNANFLDVVVDYRRYFVSVIVVLTAVLACFIPRLSLDPGLKSGLDHTSEAYAKYQTYLRDFGHEEFILAAVKYESGAGDPRVLAALNKVTTALETMDKVVEVLSPTNLKIFQKRGELFSNYPILRGTGDSLSLPDRADLAGMKKGLPLLELLISDDLKTLGVLVRVDEQSRYDPAVTAAIVAQIDRTLKESSPPGTEFRVIGAPLIRQAIVRYNIQTGVIFGILCLLIGTVVSVYVFKSASVTAITNVILTVCVVWVLGLMGLLEIPLNSTTALSFGFIPITTLEIVIHMVVRYHQFHRTSRDKTAAVKQAVRWLARPCLVCSATTAVGFGTLMISSIPMVRQLGFIMSQGIIVSYFLAMILTPAFFMVMKSLDAPEESGVIQDKLDRFLERIQGAIFSHARLFVIIGVVITVFLFSGAPMIRSDTQILRMLSDRAPEIQDLAFVETNLTAVNSLELMVETEDGAFKNADAWRKIQELEERVSEIPEVVSVDSFLPLLKYLGAIVDGQADKPRGLFADPTIIPQLLVLTSMSKDGERVMRRFLNDEMNRLRISVRIRNSPTVPLSETIARIDAVAESVMRGTAKSSVTGELVVVAHQTENLITDQIKSMFIAVAIISLLMMIQMQSVVLGLICLIPNIPPVAAVFGIMGWFGVSLDAVTVFAATVAIGLAVDNTIHFLTQLKREIILNPAQGTESCVASAYRFTAKQIFSWNLLTLLGFLALAVSPFRPVVFFGILGCSSLVLGLYGDLIFLQSLILSSSVVRNTIRKLIDRQVGG